MLHLQRNMRGWKRVWDIIKERYGDTACLELNECWQYMGTSETAGHSFRHRSYKGKRAYDWVHALWDDFEIIGPALCLYCNKPNEYQKKDYVCFSCKPMHERIYGKLDD